MVMHKLTPTNGCGVRGIGATLPVPILRLRGPSQSSPRLGRAQAHTRGSVEPDVGVLDVVPTQGCNRAAPYMAGAAALATLGAALPALASDPAFDLSALFIPGIVGDDPLREGFLSGFLLIFFSEIGDKTFFIALLLALKEDKNSVFIGTFGALAIMTVISVFLGQALHQLDELVPKDSLLSSVPLDDVVATALLIWFGIKTIQAAKDAEDTAKEEKEEAQEVVDGFGAEDATKLVLSTFALVFAAEWGDKSFLATIALAASSSPLGVTVGAVAGHGVATGIAVAGGSLLSQYFSESVLQYVGGTLFLVFAGATIVDLVGNLN